MSKRDLIDIDLDRILVDIIIDPALIDRALQRTAGAECADFQAAIDEFCQRAERAAQLDLLNDCLSEQLQLCVHRRVGYSRAHLAEACPRIVLLA